MNNSRVLYQSPNGNFTIAIDQTQLGLGFNIYTDGFFLAEIMILFIRFYFTKDE